MPTFFTALQSHARAARFKAHHPAHIFTFAGSTGRGLQFSKSQIPSEQKKERRKQPVYYCSLMEKFNIRKWQGSARYVVIVGGGFAGLSAAYELASMGYRVTVLEAQKGVGGRVESKRNGPVPGQVVEHGAELIGLNHRAWWSYKRILGLHLRPILESGTSPVILGKKLLSTQQALFLLREMSAAQKLINNAARAVNAHEPWNTARANVLDRRSLAQGLKAIPMSSRCRLAYLELLQADNGVQAEKQSWLGVLAMIKGGGLGRYWNDTETHRCVGGNQQLAYRLKSKLSDVRTGWTVKIIEIGAKGATVYVNGRKRIECDDVVLAIPPSLWFGPKGLKFKPGLPRTYTVQFGKNVKYLLNVKKASWKPDSANMSTDGPVDLTWEATDGQHGNRAGLVSFSGANNAVACVRWRKDARRKYLRILGSVYPDMINTAGTNCFVNWPGNKWARGSYSFPAPGQVTTAIRLLHSGFEERLHFAGEHTCPAFVGYMEGALQSGLRVAEQLARRDGLLGRRKRSGC